MSYCAVYLNRIHREKNLPEKPEDPLILEKSIPSDADFTFVDFVPSVLMYSSSAHEVEYHRFSHLVETANAWIHKNPQWNIVNCETVRLSYRHNVTSMVSRWEQQINPVTPLWSPISRGEFETVLKALRLWIQRKEDDEIDECNPNAIKLKYMDFIPKRLSENSFETIDDLMDRINSRLKESDTFSWNIITLESMKIESNSEWIIDPEESLADVETSRHLTVLRLFYEDYSTTVFDTAFFNEDYPLTVVGIEDFKPRLISAGSFFKRPEFEPFNSLVQRASKWLSESHSARHFLNAQSIDIKIKSLTKLDTRTCTNIEHGDYIQFLRIIYFKLIPRMNEQAERMIRSKTAEPNILNQLDLLFLCSKVFVATKLDHPLDSMQQRIYNWLHSEANQNVCVLGAETINVFGKDDDERELEKKTGECFQGNRLGSLNSYTFKAVRVYYCQMQIANIFGDRSKYYHSVDCYKTFPLHNRNFPGSSRERPTISSAGYHRKSTKLKVTNKDVKQSNSFKSVQFNEPSTSVPKRSKPKLAKQETTIGFIKCLRNPHQFRNRSTSCSCM